MKFESAMAMVAHLFPGAPMYSPAYPTADGSMPYQMLLVYIAKIPMAQARDRLNQSRAAMIARRDEFSDALEEDALTEASK